MRQKKIPLRMCINCREMKPKREMIRLVKSESGEIDIDPTGKKPGRGAYICGETECVTTAKKQKKIERSFGVAGCEHIYKVLLENAEGTVDK